MSRCFTNIVNLVPSPSDQFRPAIRRDHEIDKDCHELVELSLRLRGLRRDLTAELSGSDAAAASMAEGGLKLRANAFIEQIEALEAGMNKLIGAMMTHQPR